MKKASIHFFVFAIVAMCSALVAQSGHVEPLKPFHLVFVKYEQNLSDGTYTFEFRFNDLPVPHVILPDAPKPKTEFKIGDTIGRYKIVNFSPRIERPGPNDEFYTRDVSTITLQNLTKPSEKVAVPFRIECNLPEAGLQ